MKIDLHCHTGLDMKPNMIYKMAKLRGLDGIAIVDCNRINGYNYVRREIKDRNFLVIPGFEYRGLEINEVLVLGIDFVPQKKPLLDFIDEVRENGGICIVPHPFTPAITERFMAPLEVLKNFDGLEVINSFDIGSYVNLANRVADAFNLAKTAGSDAHSLRNIGLAYTICEDPIKDIMKRSTKVWGIESPWSYKISNILGV